MEKKKTLLSAKKRSFSILAICFFMTWGAAAVQAASSSAFPSKPIRLVVAAAPGGPNDFIARVISPKMGQILGQQIVVDNRAGAGQVIGSEIVAKAPPDGYTLLLISGTHVINPAMVKKLPYDTITDFAGVSIIAESPVALLVTTNLPVKNVKELIALAKARPGELNYASTGRGSQAHFATEWFCSMAGIKMVHVPYKGAGPALVDLMSGQVQLLFANVSGVVQYARDGKVHMIAQSGKKRASSAPDIPTLMESGLPGFTFSSNFGLVAPAGTPRPIIDRLRNAVVEALADPVVKSKIAGQGAEPVGSTPEELEAATKAEIARWIKVGSEAGIKPE